jgi:hypothetical protein
MRERKQQLVKKHKGKIGEGIPPTASDFREITGQRFKNLSTALKPTDIN